MLRTNAFILLAGLLLGVSPALGTGPVDPDTTRKRHDYRLSFKQPYFLYANESPLTIPYFDEFAGVMPNQDFIRLTPSVPDQKAAIWAKKPNPYKEWQAIFSFNVNGRGYYGGDGFAFWLTKERGEIGPVYGSRDMWQGFGLLFDSAEPEVNRYTPYMYGVINHGDASWANRHDYASASLGGCFRDYRGALSPAWVRVTYANRTLRVDTDIRQNGHSYTECFTQGGVDIPTGYYFGFSAATERHIADDHDIVSFETYDLNPVSVHKKQDDNWHMTDEMKHKIEEVEKEVTEARKEESVPHNILDPHAIEKLAENQFHMLEALNNLQQQKESLSKTNGVNDALSVRIDDIITRLVRMEDELKRVEGTLSGNLNQANAQLNSVHSTIAQTLHEQKNANSPPYPAPPSAGGHWALYLGAFGGGVVLAFIYNTIRRRKEEQSKKYF